MHSTWYPPCQPTIILCITFHLLIGFHHHFSHMPRPRRRTKFCMCPKCSDNALGKTMIPRNLAAKHADEEEIRLLQMPIKSPVAIQFQDAAKLHHMGQPGVLAMLIANETFIGQP